MRAPNLTLSFDGIPPSTNHAYRNGAFGRRVLSSVGAAYKKDITARVTQEVALGPPMSKDRGWMVWITVTTSILSQGWPKKAKNRYKTLDATNRIKLIEDAVKDGIGLDDSCTLRFIIEKKEGVDHTLVRFWDLSEGDPLE